MSGEEDGKAEIYRTKVCPFQGYRGAPQLLETLGGRPQRFPVLTGAHPSESAPPNPPLPASCETETDLSPEMGQIQICIDRLLRVRHFDSSSRGFSRMWGALPVKVSFEAVAAFVPETDEVRRRVT